MMSIHPYHVIHQAKIDAMMVEIAAEFDQPISNSSLALPSKIPDTYWLAFQEEKLIGTTGLDRLVDKNVVLKRMFVRKAFRGKTLGVATQLLQTALDYCRTEGRCTIYLGTMSQFQAAHRFYEKHGFEQILAKQLPTDMILNPIDDRFYRINI